MQVARIAPDWPAPSLMHRRRVVPNRITYVGLDVLDTVEPTQQLHRGGMCRDHLGCEHGLDLVAGSDPGYRGKDLVHVLLVGGLLGPSHAASRRPESIKSAMPVPPFQRRHVSDEAERRRVTDPQGLAGADWSSTRGA